MLTESDLLDIGYEAVFYANKHHDDTVAKLNYAIWLGLEAEFNFTVGRMVISEVLTAVELRVPGQVPALLTERILNYISDNKDAPMWDMEY